LEILCCKLNDLFGKKDCQNSKIIQFYNIRENRIFYGWFYAWVFNEILKIAEKKNRNFPNLFLLQKETKFVWGFIESLLCSMWGPLGEEQQRPQNINLRGRVSYT
jgi:hypothetical protein